ncbi:UNVERIFIED_CONTAM: protein TRI1 [Sesamum latifolium]|uniref:Protein TRI1 n=1 Tax=Sesamum latifolium TaxID=2727402 RepID=A0AAW2UZQ4_9LAMI
MAMSLPVFSSFLPAQTRLLCHSSSSAPLGLVSANLRGLRSVMVSASSKPVMETKKREPRGIMKPRRVSPEMQAFLGVAEIPRTRALKEIWAHIKQHNLQDPEDKKVIICDEKLKKIFGGRDRVGFLEIAGLINPHFLK